MNYYVVRVADDKVTIGSDLGEETLTPEEIFLLKPLKIEGIEYLSTRVKATQYKGLMYGTLYVRDMYRNKGTRMYRVVNVMNDVTKSFSKVDLARFVKHIRPVAGVTILDDGDVFIEVGVSPNIVSATSARLALMEGLKVDVTSDGKLVYFDLQQITDKERAEFKGLYTDFFRESSKRVIELGKICNSISKGAIFGYGHYCTLKLDDRVKYLAPGWFKGESCNVDVTDLTNSDVKKRVYMDVMSAFIINKDEFDSSMYAFTVACESWQMYFKLTSDLELAWLKEHKEQMLSELSDFPQPNLGNYDWNIWVKVMNDLPQSERQFGGVNTFKFFKSAYKGKKKPLVIGYMVNSGHDTEIRQLFLARMRDCVIKRFKGVDFSMFGGFADLCDLLRELRKSNEI